MVAQPPRMLLFAVRVLAIEEPLIVPPMNSCTLSPSLPGFRPATPVIGRPYVPPELVKLRLARLVVVRFPMFTIELLPASEPLAPPRSVSLITLAPLPSETLPTVCVFAPWLAR